VELPPSEQMDDLAKIRFLLSHWRDIWESPLQGPGYGGSDDSVPMLPEVAKHPTVRELDRCLGVLFVVEPVNYRHLRAGVVSVEWRIARVQRTFKLPSGKKEKLWVREREPLVPDWVQPERVEQGELFLADEFEGIPYLPKPLWRSLTEPLPVG